MTQSYRFHHYTPRRSEMDEVTRERAHRAIAAEHSTAEGPPGGVPYGKTAEKGTRVIHPHEHPPSREGPGPVPARRAPREPSAGTPGTPIGALPVTREPYSEVPPPPITEERGDGLIASARKDLKRWGIAVKELGAASWDLLGLSLELVRRTRRTRGS